MKKNQPKNILRRNLLIQLSVLTGVGVMHPFGLKAETLLNLETQDSVLPQSPLLSDDEKPVRLIDFKGTSLLVNFWASWCAPCVVELPMFERAATILAEQGIKIMLVSMDRGGRNTARPFLDARNINTPISVYDPKAEWARALKLKGLPTTFLIKKDQTSYAMHAGPAEWDNNSVLSQITDYLT